LNAECTAWDAEQICHDLRSPDPGLCWEVKIGSHWHETVKKWWDRLGIQYDEVPGGGISSFFDEADEWVTLRVKDDEQSQEG